MNRVCTIQASAAQKIIKFASGYGVSAGALCESVKLNPALITDPDKRIPFAQLVALYEQAALLSGDDSFGLRLGQSIDPRVFDVLGYAAMNSATVGEAFARVARYHSIWTDGAQIDLTDAGVTVSIVYRYLDSAIKERRQDAEMTLAAFIALGRLVTDADLTPIEVKFSHAAPPDTSEHARVFRCPVRFDAAGNEVRLKSAVLALPIVKADPGLCAVLDRHAQELLAKYPPQDVIINPVRSIIRRELNGGDPSLERIAHHLGMSPRTLQRRLREQGTSHQELLDQMRRDLAVRYLNERAMALCEIAYLLGFSERSAFHRAFKRWTGMTPSEFRQSNFDGTSPSQLI